MKKTYFFLFLMGMTLLTFSAQIVASEHTNPCNPCAMKMMKHQGNPCAMKMMEHQGNPCATKMMKHQGNPCATKMMKHQGNPCAMKMMKHQGNPCAMKMMKHQGNPCATKMMEHQGNPCNPCAMKKPMNPCMSKMGGNLTDRVTRPAGTQLWQSNKTSRATLISEGEKQFNDTALSSNGTACSNCHATDALFKPSFAKEYPHYIAMADQRIGMKSVDADEIVQFCIAVPMEGKPLDWQGRELAALTAYVTDVKQKEFIAKQGVQSTNPCGMKMRHNNPCNPCAMK